jgi:hypothetical protein
LVFVGNHELLSYKKKKNVNHTNESLSNKNLN